MRGSGTFVYLLEEEAVLAMLPGWPSEMQVAVCLSADGGCDLAVHHKEEVTRVLDRIRELHGWSSEALCVAPEVAGYPTRKVLFSEEQQLLSVVGESPHLVELASDYALNYRFAQDEGLDTAAATGADQRQTPVTTAAQDLSDTAGEPSAKGMSRRSQAFITHLSLPAGYATPASRPECAFVEAHLLRQNGRVRLLIEPASATGAEMAVQVDRIGCRDDYARFVLPRHVLNAWSRGQAALVEMPEDVFPEAVVDRFMRVPHRCSVTVTVRGVFITPLEPVDVPQTAPAVPVAAPARRRFFSSVHLAVAGLVAVMVVTGHFAAAFDRMAEPSVAIHAPGDGADVALDLIASMALADRADQALAVSSGMSNR